MSRFTQSEPQVPVAGCDCLVVSQFEGRAGDRVRHWLDHAQRAITGQASGGAVRPCVKARNEFVSALDTAWRPRHPSDMSKFGGGGEALRDFAPATVLILLVLLFSPVAPARGVEITSTSTPKMYPPAAYFDKDPSPTSGTWDYEGNGWVIVYTSHGGTRYRLAMGGGSGTGSANTCYRDNGWLPNGSYPIDFYYKTTGNAVVQGWVWYLGSKRCNTGSTIRTELFMHSSGIETLPWSGHYSSNGCVKIAQGSGGTDGGDRGITATYWYYGFAKDSGTYYVIS